MAECVECRRGCGFCLEGEGGGRGHKVDRVKGESKGRPWKDQRAQKPFKPFKTSKRRPGYWTDCSASKGWCEAGNKVSLIWGLDIWIRQPGDEDEGVGWCEGVAPGGLEGRGRGELPSRATRGIMFTWNGDARWIGSGLLAQVRGAPAWSSPSNRSTSPSTKKEWSGVEWNGKNVLLYYLVHWPASTEARAMKTLSWLEKGVPSPPLSSSGSLTHLFGTSQQASPCVDR